ncbi:MAG: IclR family transcriptional regulator [Chloroflexota bacterium]
MTSNEGELKRNLMNGEEVNENYIVSSLVRGLQILSTFTTKRPSLKVSEIAEINGLDQATVFRFVYTLEKLGYLVRDEETKRYRQGVRMLTIGLPAREGITIRHASLPIMYELSKTVNETVRLAVLDDVEAVTVAVAEIPDRIYFRTPIGDRAPSYGTALGKVLLAFQPIENWDRLISRIEFVQHTDKTIVDPALFREELSKTCEQGYAIQDSELIVGLASVAAPIFDYQNHLAAAIDVSGLSMQIFDEGKRDYFISELLKSARRISEELGHTP